MNAIEAFKNSKFFADFPEAQLAKIAELAAPIEVAEDELLMQIGEMAEAFFVLDEGELRVSFKPSAQPQLPSEDHGPPRFAELPYTTNRSGHALGWTAVLEPHRYRADAVALRPSRVWRVSREDLEQLLATDGEFALPFAQRMLWHTGQRLQATRNRIVSKRYANQAEAIQALLDGAGSQLEITSPLHRIPHLVASRLTLADAFATIDTLQQTATGSERELADLIADLLEEIRSELKFFQQLQAIYQLVATAPADAPPAQIRELCVDAFGDLFVDTRHVVVGRENLPASSGHIFVMNHVVNHKDNQLPGDFALTLDTNFVSSMILKPRYGYAPVRVIRKSSPEEYSHQRFYDRLGYIYVYSGHVDPTGTDPDSTPEQRRRLFLDQAAAELTAGNNIVICPEGTSVSTEESPVPFKSGAFHLANYAQSEPLIVPIAVANFDKKVTRCRTAAVIGEPWQLSECVGDQSDPQALRAFIDGVVQPKIVEMVGAARELAGPPVA